MELFILFGITICGQVLGITLSGNGTSGGFTVHENSSLQLTCSSSTDFKYASYNRRYTDKTPDIITAVGYGSSGCATDPTPPAYLSCSCVSKREYVCVIRNVTRAMNGDVWFCIPPADNTNSNSGDKTIVVTIGITAVSMVLPSDHSVSVINNTTRQFRCETSAGNPQASVEWYKDNGTLDRADDTPITTGIETDTSASGTIIVTIGKLTLTVQRNDHDVGVYCRANNGGDWLYSSSAVLDVQYKPLTPKVFYKHSEVTYPVRVISGRSITLTCSSTGNPSPTYTWTFPGRGSQSGPMLTLASVQTAHTGDIACIAMNMLSPTGGTTVEKKRQATINLQVLYSPRAPSCTIGGTSISTTAILVEGIDRNISCISSANPPLISYTWSTPGRGQVSGASLSLVNVQHPADQGQYTLTVTNTMDPTGENTETGTGNTMFSVDVQFGPQVQPTGTHDILRGRDLNFKCPFVSGNPAKTSFVWTRSIDKRQWNSQIVSITSVQKSDDGIYTCTATNHMTPTGSPGLTGNHSGTLHLNVQYKSVVSDFHVTEHIGNFNVTKSEYSNVKFTCTVDSNPQASINIRKEGEIRRSVNNSTQLEYTIANLTCWDAGLYTCDGSNEFNTDTPSRKNLKLLVTCKPRRPPGEDTQLTFTARHHEQVALKYTVFAYPVPSPSQFVWKRCKTTCAQLSNFPGKYEIKTTGLSSNLTILDIETGDYGVYSISVSNGIGKDLVENIYLKPAGPPDPPTEFHVIEESIGETQAILTWIPGFNNGLSQTFHLSYGTLIEFATITKVNISHNEFEKSINYTINKLEPEKQYYVELFASNAKGKSMRVNATFTTLVRIVNPMGPSAAIIGGSIGGVIFAVLIVGGVILGVIKLRKLGQKKDREMLAGNQRVDALSHHVDGDADIPDVVENTMYVPAEDISRQINTSGADALYAQPNKTKASSSAAAAKKHGKKAYENKIFEDSSLENHELTENKKNVNKDGLVYADLDFPKPQKGQTPYIHGLDDRTVYEEVDLSRKADPLQDSDDNASGKNKN
ncbi:hemicentin-1-like isoform X2 [Mya arenaria]|uniref:hemicentin-1-like isoform X2 n=1 Tax=Mya arenaria TaxID=6604 RepID=UPI0022E844DB|nr:hemicentin-1-like isoform X2 [Mya arenaria]